MYCVLKEKGKVFPKETTSRSGQTLSATYLVHGRHVGLVEVRAQLRLLKMVWDMVGLVDGLFASWTSTLWADIRVSSIHITLIAAAYSHSITNTIHLASNSANPTEQHHASLMRTYQHPHYLY